MADIALGIGKIAVSITNISSSIGFLSFPVLLLTGLRMLPGIPPRKLIDLESLSQGRLLEETKPQHPAPLPSASDSKIIEVHTV